MKRVGALLGVTLVLSAASPELNQALKLYELTEFEQSLKILQTIPVKDAGVYALMGRDYFMDGDYKKATDVLEKAVAAHLGDAADVSDDELERLADLIRQARKKGN